MKRFLALLCALLFVSCDEPTNNDPTEDTALDTTPDVVEEIVEDSTPEPVEDLEPEFCPGSSSPFAVVELFTSEGCSYCPSADGVLATVVPRMIDEGERVYPIAWHVDYWDYLGWPDRFASSDITARQHWYADVMGSTTVGTPAMWVNIRPVTSMTPAAVHGMINLRLEDVVEVSVTLWLESGPDDSPIVVGYEVLDAPVDSRLTLVLVERGLSSVVTAGENMGRTLHHDNVARDFLYTTEWSGHGSFIPPADLVVENCSVIGFVQSTTNLYMLGADSFELID